MKFQSVNIKNFRCFEDITIDFHEQLTVLVGGNGCGKTAVLDAVGALCEWSAVDKSVLHQHVMPLQGQRLGARDKASMQYTVVDKDNFTIRYYRSIDTSHQRPALGTYLHVSTSHLTYQDTLKWFADKEADEAKHAIKIRDINYRFDDLQAVRMAVSQVLGEYDFPFTAKVPVDMFICKKGAPDIEYSVSQLSDGYRHMLAFVMHLASQMSIANAEQYKKEGTSVLESPAIVLIDEVDLHLHPSWQQRILPDLMRTFPKTQFIVTTHSPQVISSIPHEHIRILENGTAYTMSTVTEGVDSARVL